MSTPPSGAAQAYDVLVFIGRFQPFHLGHKAVIDRALELSQRVIVLVGSAGSNRSLRNPFTSSERSQMILGAYPDDIGARILIAPLVDTPDSDPSWVRQVRRSVQEMMRPYQSAGIPRVGLIGHNKDSSSYYLGMFPEWPCEFVGRAAEVDATDVRWSYLRSLAVGSYQAFTRETAALLPAATLAFLERFAAEDAAAGELADEWRMVEHCRRTGVNAPNPPIVRMP